MIGRQGGDGGWLIEPPEDPEIYDEIMAVMDSLPEETQAMVHSLLNAVTSKSFAIKDRVALIDDLHDVYLVPPTGKPPCWVVAVNGYTGRPMAAALCTERPGKKKAESFARRVLGLSVERD